MLIVSEGTSLGISAWIWAWRDGICPWPACRTWPKIDLLDLVGGDAGALERRADRLAAELRSALGGERSAHLPERGARGAEDDCLGHRSLSVSAARAAQDRLRC